MVSSSRKNPKLAFTESELERARKLTSDSLDGTKLTVTSERVKAVAAHLLPQIMKATAENPFNPLDLNKYDDRNPHEIRDSLIGTHLLMSAYPRWKGEGLVVEVAPAPGETQVIKTGAGMSVMADQGGFYPGENI